MTSIRIGKALLSSLALVAAGTGAASAAPGDIHRVAGADVVNLRAGPSDETNIRGRVEQGDEVIELTREGSWVGVRVLQTGEEGWIFGGLLDTVSQSGLSPSIGASDAGFLQLSESFDVLMRRIITQLGFPVVDSVEQTGSGFLRVVPTQQWLLNGSREAHMMAAAAIYQMWKNHQNSAPVGVVMTDAAGEDYITIRDEAAGPSLSIAQWPRPEPLSWRSSARRHKVVAIDESSASRHRAAAELYRGSLAPRRGGRGAIRRRGR